MQNAITTFWHVNFRGLLIAAVIAAAATFLSEHYGAPAMLFALLIGMAFHFLHTDVTFSKGLDFSAKTLLRFGVGLLGLRLSISDVESVGYNSVGAGRTSFATLACGAVFITSVWTAISIWIAGGRFGGNLWCTLLHWRFHRSYRRA